MMKPTPQKEITIDMNQIQTKYTTVRGQDLGNLPYDLDAPISEQIHASLKSSFLNLRVSADPFSSESTILDCLVLHSPLPSIEATIEAWRTLETYVPHRIRNLGISNIQTSWLRTLYEAASIKPAVVQNRFVRQSQFDRDIRSFCIENSIVYQSFWTFTGNKELANGPEVELVANQLGIKAPEALYCLILTLDNVIVLNGTTKQEHMLGDLVALQTARDWAEKHPGSWKSMVDRFRVVVDKGTSSPVS